MMLTAKQERAIGLFARENNLRLALSLPPKISFVDRDGATIEWNVDELVDMYDQLKKQEARERAKERARERRSEGSFV